jgi:hypothetical protein
MVRWNGFAELSFADSARLAFARALDQAQTDVHGCFPDAWVIEDRRIAFSVIADTNRTVLEGIQRLLGALVLGAVAGDALIESENPRERWTRRVAVPAISHEAPIGRDLDEEGNSETIRTAAS